MRNDIGELKCVICGTSYKPEEAHYTCPKCGPLGVLEVSYDYASAAKKIDRDDPRPSAWLSLLPVDSAPDFIGHFYPSPLISPQKLCDHLKAPGLLIKDDTHALTASFKDRASWVVARKAQEEGIDSIILASTGNAATSTAGICAALGIRCVVCVPKAIPKPKLAQLVAYGATIIRVDGNYDKAFDMAIAISDKAGLYNRNTGYNPYTIEGKKTVSFELFAQMKRTPDWIIVPTGDGCILGGVYKGFKDMMNAGFISSMPRLMAAQAEGSSAIYQAWKKGLTIPEAVSASTIADSISVDMPRNGVMALMALRETDGSSICVSDREILDAQGLLARESGIFAEPSSSASFAALIKALEQGVISRDEKVAMLLTGNGLKDISALSATETPVVVNVEEALSLLG